MDILIKAKERRRILHLVSDSIPQQVRFEATPVGAAPLSGVVEVAGSRWLFPKPPAHQPLQRDNLVRKGMFDTFFSIYVTPDHDTRVVLHTRHFTSRMLVWVLAAVVVLGIAGALVATLPGG